MKLFRKGAVLTMTMIVRPATAADAADIARINVHTWLHTYKGLIEQSVLDSLSIEKRHAFWLRVIAEKKDTSSILVCQDLNHVEASTGVIGYISGGLSRLSGYDAELYALYCDVQSQSKGAGTMLLGNFLAFSMQRRYQTVCVRVLSANPYKRFYYKHGAVFGQHVMERIADKDYLEEVAFWSLEYKAKDSFSQN